MAKESKNKVVKEQKKNIKDKKSFGKDFKAELKKVTWPTPKQLLNNTTAVISIALLTTVIVFALDFVFELGNKYGVENLKKVVGTSNTTENTVTEENNTENNDQNDIQENTTVEENNVQE